MARLAPDSQADRPALTLRQAQGERGASIQTVQSLTPAPIALDTLIGHPQPLGRWSRLPEHIDWNAAARIPIAADPEPPGLHLLEQALADPHRAILVKGGVVAEAAQKQLQRLGFDDRVAGRIVDHQMRKIGLSRNRAQRCELRDRKRGV